MNISARVRDAFPGLLRALSRAPGRTIALALGGLACILAGGAVWAAAGGAHAAHEPTPSQIAAASLEFPASAGTLPASISVKHDPKADRTRMRLSGRGSPFAAPPDFQVRELRWAMTSEHAGESRRPGVGEISVQCTITVYSRVAGALAPSSPPVTFEADGVLIAALPSKKGESGYSTKAQKQGVRESVAFKVYTKDLITLASARVVRVRCGVVTFTMTRQQAADLKEFAARMKPPT